MSVTIPKIPPAILRAYSSGLSDFTVESDGLQLLQSPLALEAFALQRPDESIKGPDDWNLLPSQSSARGPTRQIGWRVSSLAQGVHCGGHIGVADQRSAFKMTGFSTADQILTQLELFNQLHTMPELMAGVFEPRILRITWLHLEAIWLHLCDGDSDSPDYLIIFSGFPPKGENGAPLEIGHPYPWSYFRRLIWDIAVSRKKR